MKTRLARDIGDDAALACHRTLLARTAKTLDAFRHRELWTSGAVDAYASVPELDAWPRHAQRGTDLGQRMADAFRHGVTILVGSDIPGLTPTYVQDAIDALATHDIVVGPTEDGGYCLIGMNSAHDEVFTNIDWSTDVVCRQTLDRCHAAGLTVSRLEPLWDVDTFADYQRAVSYLA